MRNSKRHVRKGKQGKMKFVSPLLKCISLPWPWPSTQRDSDAALQEARGSGQQEQGQGQQQQLQGTGSQISRPRPRSPNYTCRATRLEYTPPSCMRLSWVPCSIHKPLSMTAMFCAFITVESLSTPSKKSRHQGWARSSRWWGKELD